MFAKLKEKLYMFCHDECRKKMFDLHMEKDEQEKVITKLLCQINELKAVNEFSVSHLERECDLLRERIKLLETPREELLK